MEQMHFQDMRSEKEKEEAKSVCENLKKDQTFTSLLQERNISLSHCDMHPYMLQRWYTNYLPCITCNGLSTCKQMQNGYFNDLVDDGYLHIEKHACPYMQHYLQERNHLDHYLLNDLPKEMETTAFETLKLDNEPTQYLQVVQEALQAIQQNHGLYIYGTMGSGKTYLASCACNHYARNHDSVVFVHYPSFVQRMIRELESGEYKTTLQKLLYAKFVVIDDIGAEAVTEWNRDTILLPILNERYEKGLLTWFTSNEDLETLLTHFTFTTKGKQEKMKALRILERIKAMAKPVILTTKSKRKYF